MEENKKYKLVTTLIDGTEIISYIDYNWGLESELNDERKDFVDICGNMIRRETIKTMIYSKNENYIEPESEDK